MVRVEEFQGRPLDAGNPEQRAHHERRESVRETRRRRSVEAATHFMTPLLDTVEAQVKALETNPDGPLPHPIAGLASWGAFNGIFVSTSGEIDSLYDYFPNIPKMGRGMKMSEFTGGEITYGSLLADRIHHLLTNDLRREGNRTPSKETVSRRARSITIALRSWSRIPLLPGFLVKQFLWYVPDPDKDIMENLPSVCRETQVSLELLSQGASESIRPALTQITRELDRANRLVTSLRTERHGITRFAIPRAFMPLLLPLRVTAEEYLEERSTNPASHQHVATEIAEAYLLGRHGFDPENIKEIFGYFAGQSPVGVPLEPNGFKFESATCHPIVPWLTLEFQRLGICELTKADYEDLRLTPDVWQYHLFELEEQQALNHKEFSATDPDVLTQVYKQHYLIINSPLPPPRVSEGTLVLAAPGKYYPWAHLRHRAMNRAGLEVAKSGFFGNTVVMSAPNRRDPDYPEMELGCPVKTRAQRLKRTLTGLLGSNLFVSYRGQDDGINSNQDKFDLGFPHYLQRRFGVSSELGFLGGFEKAPLYRKRKAVLTPRLGDLVNLPRALASIKAEIGNYGERNLVIALLSCMDYSGQCIRDLIEQGDEESLIQLSTMLHRPLLLALEKKFRSTQRSAEARTLHQLLT